MPARDPITINHGYPILESSSSASRRAFKASKVALAKFAVVLVIKGSSQRRREEMEGEGGGGLLWRQRGRVGQGEEGETEQERHISDGLSASESEENNIEFSTQQLSRDSTMHLAANGLSFRIVPLHVAL